MFQIAYISFSAHTDYTQTSGFIRALRPPHLVLVHGEMNEMNRLKAAIVRQYEDEPDFHIEVKFSKSLQGSIYWMDERMNELTDQLSFI